MSTESLSPNQRAWRRFRKNKFASACGGLLVALLVVILLWPVLSSPTVAKAMPGFLSAGLHTPNEHSAELFAPPSGKHWFGTDIHGRDIFSRVIYGARVSLLVGAVGACVSLVIGVLWGAAAGYLGGRWDSWLMRVVDVLYSLPSIIFVIVLITTLHGALDKLQSAGKLTVTMRDTAKFVGLFVGLGAVSWLTMARIVRGQVASLKRMEFVEAAHALGLRKRRIILRHMIPNVLGPVIVYTTLTVPAVMLLEAFLSFLGLGVQPPMSSWGSMIKDGADRMEEYWWMLVFPAGAFSTTLFCLNFLGDGLRDALDVRASKD